ncbi:MULTISPECIES: serine--tRNA ligase [Streptomyces]|uniref:serine--tRNA ligase n=1 Tax=Streptomyces TaxID=1883 RepID=UPI000F776047|nr:MULTISPECIES: serine--tRNA ligase [Streptomyces]RST05470.1 serine--tRNA ligase [Streptomyces sp. WAC07149]GLX22988.1 serine--tRNA ligase [Streptomyces lavendulae subsp. lavendulae]GLX30450.1 serine--tRNA ligase [Streptomyces lavendulae subsp. lavendulae]
MHDPHSLLQEAAGAGLARRGHVLDRAALRDLTEQRARLVTERDKLRAEQNRSAKGGVRPDDAARARTAAAKERLRSVSEELREAEEGLAALLLAVPNLPYPDVPDGTEQDPPVVRRTWGEVPGFEFAPRDHVDIGTRLGILDQVRAARLSGSRFAVTRGAGARLERALAAFLLDLHTTEHGYTEHGVPHLVTRETMTGTGQLPKFEDDLFLTGAADRDLLLIPTAEVPLVNLYRGETLREEGLPLALTACTPCYRAEAGSYGRDTRGLVRLHQFEKVELVRICRPEDSAAELELLTGHAETALRRLGLAHRVVELRAGDLGFAARRTYDIEVWLPGQGTYREISSCSDCGDFQGRRAGIKVRDRDGRKRFAATLNGSALPVGRTLVAVLEQYQRADGSVAVPPALVPYTGFSAIAPDGSPVVSAE